MKRLFKAVLLSLVAILIVGMPVLAAVVYRATYVITEEDGNPYDMLPVLELVDNQWMADNGFMSASALDTRIETLGGLTKPHMVATNKTLTSVAVLANSQTNLYFTTANPDLSSMDIIAGYGGKITVADDASLRLVANFEIEIDDAYINTDFVGTKNLVYKEDAFRIYVSAAASVTAVMSSSGGATYNPDKDPETDSVDGDVRYIDAGGVDWGTIQGAAVGTEINDDANVASAQWRCDGNAGKWDIIHRGILLFDTAPIPDGAEVISAVLSVWGITKTDGKPWGDLTINVFSSNPASDDGLVIADYNQVGTTAFATPITWAAYDAAGWNAFTLNATGLAAIDVAGISKFSLREATYDAPDVAPAWDGGSTAKFEFRTAEEAGKEPKLVVTYLETVAVTATNVASGQHDIRTWADGGKLYISVDSATAPDPKYDEENLVGAEVFGNANDWLIMDNSTTDFMPYMGYYKHTTAIGGSSFLKAWYQPNYMVEADDHAGTTEAGTDDDEIFDASLTEAADHWVGGLVTITSGARDGETSVCSIYAVGHITVDPVFTGAIGVGETYTVDFGTLIDRSYYGVEFDAADDIIACGAAADMDITDEATLTAWVYIDSDGETFEGSIIDRRDGADGYRLYVSSEAGGNVAIEAILDCAVQDAHAVSEVVVSTGGWHYIVAVYNRLGTFHWEIYEDGVLLTLTTDNDGQGAIVAHTANEMNIGDNAASDRCFDGKIDEPSFYTIAWTQGLVTPNYNAGVGLYTPTDTTSIALQLHMEEGTGAPVADTSGEANNGTIANALWVTGKVPRPAGDAGTFDSRLTWGANPTGVGVTIGGMVSAGQPVPGSIPADPAQDILPETEVTDWFEEPAVGVGESLLTNPLRPFVTMLSDNSTLTELQSWRLLTLAMILLVTVSTAFAVGKHQGITAIMGGVAILGAVVLTIFPMWALVFAIGMFIGGLVMERSPSL